MELFNLSMQLVGAIFSVIAAVSTVEVAQSYLRTDLESSILVTLFSLLAVLTFLDKLDILNLMHGGEGGKAYSITLFITDIVDILFYAGALAFLVYGKSWGQRAGFFWCFAGVFLLFLLRNGFLLQWQAPILKWTASGLVYSLFAGAWFSVLLPSWSPLRNICVTRLSPWGALVIGVGTMIFYSITRLKAPGRRLW